MGRGSSQSYAIDANTAHSHGMPHPTGTNEARNNVDVLDVGVVITLTRVNKGKCDRFLFFFFFF
jgi:hypothetical protein